MNPTAKALRQRILDLRAQHQGGQLDAGAYDQARAPLERQLLDLLLRQPVPAGAAAALPASAALVPAPRVGLPVLAAMALAAALVASAGYFWSGSPERLNRAGGATAEASAQGDAAMVEKLAERLKSEPDDVDGWQMLGRAYLSMGRAAEAVTALERAVKLRPNDATLLADLADTLAVKNGNKLEGEPMKIILQALKLDPTNLKALALAGTEAFNKDDFANAVLLWDKALKAAPPDHPFVPQLRAGINEARERGKLPVPAGEAAGPTLFPQGQQPPAAAPAQR